jgi:hypothetical protein
MGKDQQLPFDFLTLFSAVRSLIQRTLPSFFGVTNVGLAHSLAPTRESAPNWKLDKMFKFLLEHVTMNMRHWVLPRKYRFSAFFKFNMTLLVREHTERPIKELTMLAEHSLKFFSLRGRKMLLIISNVIHVHCSYLASSIGVAKASRKSSPKDFSSSRV